MSLHPECLEKRIYIICPVRNMTPESKAFMDDYVSKLEANGHHCHYPPRDVDQTDKNGIDILTAHRSSIEKDDEVHVYWSKTSEGSVFDFGMLFALNKPLFLINEKDIIPDPHKSYTNVVLEYAKRCKDYNFAKPT